MCADRGPLLVHGHLAHHAGARHRQRNRVDLLRSGLHLVRADKPHFYRAWNYQRWGDGAGRPKYILGEINASCVGFSTHLELSDNIADEVLDLMDAESVVNNKWGAFTK